MNRRTWPLWLLRDVPALLGVLLSFWPLLIIVIANGRKAMLGRKINPAVYDHIMQMVPVAEARLRYALARQAFRALGWDPRHVRLEMIPIPATWEETNQRFHAYRLAMLDLATAAQQFTDSVRRAYRIRTHVDANATRVAPGWTVALRAAHHEAVGVAAFKTTGCLALMVSSARSTRPPNHEGVLANSRGPPVAPRFQTSSNTRLSATRLRPHPHALPSCPPRKRGGTLPRPHPSKQGKLPQRGPSPHRGEDRRGRPRPSPPKQKPRKDEPSGAAVCLIVRRIS